MSLPPLLKPGDLVAARYRVIRPLASGGMGAVFVARHVATEREVALKILWPQLMESETTRAKFELEAKIAARVKSPHIVEVLDAGFDTALGMPYLVMELLQGRPLSQVPVPLDAPTLLEYLGQTAQALDLAHGYLDSQGKPTPIIHRDLKPENIFVTELRGKPFIKLLDFGIAKVLSENTHHSRDLKGTPVFMAPEQARARPVSPQTDVYALGLITFYLLTGKLYWRTAHDPEADVAALLLEIVEGSPASFTQRARELGAVVTWPPAVDAWFLGCLAPEPAARFASAGHAVWELENALLRNQAPSAIGAARLDEAIASTEPLPLRAASVSGSEPTATLSSQPSAEVAALNTSVSPLSASQPHASPRSSNRGWAWGALVLSLLGGGVLALASGSRRDNALPAAPGAATLVSVVAPSAPVELAASAALAPAAPASSAPLRAEESPPVTAPSVSQQVPARAPVKPQKKPSTPSRTPSIYDQRTQGP